MRAAGHAYNLLSPSGLRLIHEGALRILAEMGMEMGFGGVADSSRPDQIYDNVDSERFSVSARTC